MIDEPQTTPICPNCGVYPKQENHAWCKKCEGVFGDGTTVADLEARLRPTIEAMLVKDVMIGGNHLANRLHALKCTADVTEEYDDVLHDYGHEVADIWCAWKAIMALANWRRIEGIDD